MIRIEKRVWCLIVAVLLSSASSMASYKMQVRPVVVVDDEKVTIKDIADISGKNKDIIEKIETIEVLKSPSFGRETTCSVRYLKAKIERSLSNISDNIEFSGSETFTIKRDGNAITKEQILDAIREQVKKDAKDVNGNISIMPPKYIASIYAPKGDVKLRAARQSPQVLGPCIYRIDVLLNGEIYTSAMIGIRTCRTAQYAVAKKAIKQGQEISSEDVEIVNKEIPSTYEYEDLIKSTDELIGQSVNKFVSTGSPLTTTMICMPNLVNSGNRVTLKVIKGNITVNASGIVQQSGAIGDIVLVRNLDSKKTVAGQIIEKDVILVE